ncbi:MAG: AmmeMemoRadiSam system protein B [Candidatus Peregrinibacteria bacterium]
MKIYFVGFAIAIFAIFSFGCGSPREYMKISSLYPDDQRMWEHIFAEGKEGYEFASAPLGVILPHHNIVANELAKFYEGLSKVADPGVIFIVGPNHYEAGDADIQTCKNCLYTTVDGDVEVDENLVDDLASNGIAGIEDNTFTEEHAVFAHTSFIKHYFPDAKIVPIVLKWKIPTEKVAGLVKWLNENLPYDGLVIASVDFSHYIPPEAADFHDQSSFTTINNFDLKNVYKLEIDSPSSVYTILDLMKSRGYGKVERFAHTNAADYQTEPMEESTSHQFIAFYEGDVEPVSGVSVMSFGNLTSENDLTLLRGWEWDPNYDSNADYTFTKLLRDIRGKEDRFFVGSDFYVFDLPDNDCLYEEKNGSKIAFCKILEGSLTATEVRDFMKEKTSNSDLVYMLYQFEGGGEIDYDRKLAVRDLIKRGVNIFVGRGLKNVIPFEIYKGSLIFYSLGDAVKDNKLATDINATSSGMSIGVYVTEDNYYVYTFPVQINNGYPKLADASKRPTIFEAFIEEASLRRSDEIDSTKGVLKIGR